MSESNDGPKTDAPVAQSETPRQEPDWKRSVVLAAVFLLAVLLWLIPSPSGVQPRAWHLLEWWSGGVME